MEGVFHLTSAEGHPISRPDTVAEDVLVDAIRRLDAEVDRVDAFKWLCDWLDGGNVQSALLSVLEGDNDPATLAEIVDHLDALPVIPKEFGRAAWRIFSQQFENTGEHASIRAQALRGGLIVAQGDASLTRLLQSYLLDVRLDDAGEYLRHVAKVAGTILRRYPDDDFRELLTRLADVDAAADEAALELGLDRLKEGLLSKTHEALESALTAASTWFRRSSDDSENRPDAALYAICTAVLIEVQAHGLHADLSLNLPKLRRAAVEYSAFAADHHGAESWLGASSRERFHWISMANRLATIAQRFTKEIWLHAAVVIEDELLAIFFAGESIFDRTDAHGADLLGREALAKSLRRRRHYLEAINQWLEENAGSCLVSGVGRMRDTVQAALADSLSRDPFDVSTEGRLVELLRDAGLNDATAAMSAAQISVAADRNDQVSKLWSTVTSQFATAPDHSVTNARHLFEHMVTLLLRFLEFRANTARKTDPAAEYLFRREGKLPVEHDLQLDFLKFLSASDTPSFVAEQWDIGSGRADIGVSFRGVRTIVEVKQDSSVPDNRKLANRYAGQATGYLTTGVRYGFLLVLDLTERDGHQPHISEQISVERKVPAGSSTEYLIVVARVQARRRTPHALV